MTTRDCLRLSHEAVRSRRPLTRQQSLAIAELRGRYLELKRLERDRVELRKGP